MFKKIIVLVLIGLFGNAFSQTTMTIPEIKSFVTQVVTDSRNIQTLQADFTQTKSNDMIAKPMISKGKMAMQMPNTLSWKYTSPTPISLISKNGKMYINNGGKKSEFDARSKMFEKINKLMVGSANGSMFTDPDFYVLYFKGEGKNIARFLPKTKQLARYVKQLELYFPTGLATVSQVKMTDANGDLTTIDFRNVKTNAALPADAFNN